MIHFNIIFVVFGGMVISVLAIVPKIRGFKLGRERWKFKGFKIAARLPSEGK
jgi:hypothetical protein